MLNFIVATLVDDGDPIVIGVNHICYITKIDNGGCCIATPDNTHIVVKESMDDLISQIFGKK